MKKIPIKPEDVADIDPTMFTLPSFKYEVEGVDGLIVIPNCFTEEQQRYWVKRALTEYTIGNPTNLSNLAAGGAGGNEANKYAWTTLPSLDSQEMKDLRWTSVGYTFQWGGRFYDERIKTDFPDDLSSLIKNLAKCAGFRSMRPEAAIVNFYRADKSAMGAHLDDAEEEMRVPIVSLSFGSSAIFLLGGLTRDEEPITAVKVRSGDVVMMAGRARYCYHGVPRIFAQSCPEFLSNPSENVSNWQEIGKFIDKTRININVRQVKKHEV